ncbi:MAG TPA: MASE1 domain-containing protein [Gemmatimonadaceae bacterium]|nr:MASE1 domain-containing protein [Gemmatimonadaceae bacterium]
MHILVDNPRGQQLVTPETKKSTQPIRIALVAAAYTSAALLGLQLDAVSGFASLVWPASGIALAALLIGGRQYWLAVAIGAFAGNFIAGAPFLTSLGIAAGNSGAAVLGAAWLRKVPGFDHSLRRVRDVVALIILAAVGSTIVSATVGVSVLTVSGIVQAGAFGETWRAWWVGDTIGDLVVAPLILVWATWKPQSTSRRRLAEASALGLIVLAVTLVIFGAPGFAARLIHGREYMLFPPLIWASLRFGVRGSVTASALVMIVAVLRTSLGYGPFVGSDLHHSLFELQAFMGIAGATFLILGASMTERRRAARELVSAMETAEAANRAKAGFLAAVSHELRTPLNAITGYVDLLEMELDGPLTAKQHAALARISDSRRHLLRLIEDVLGFAQVEVGRLSLDIQPVRVADVVTSIEPMVAAELRRKGVTLRVEDGQPELSALADPDKLRQVLLNLVTNAIKFTEANGSITLAADDAKDQVRISVSDTGIGIPTEQLARVFDPFFQVHQGATRKYGGVGLGLSIVREVVTAMQGDVSIDSAPGKGTTVTVSLPKM